MRQRFTPRARRVMELAHQDAQRLNHEYIGTEHILLGLIKEGSGVAAKVLSIFGIGLHHIRREAERIVGVGPGGEQVLIGRLPNTPRAVQAVRYAVEEARNLNHGKIGTEHILLGLLREEESVAFQVLMDLGLSLHEVSAEIQREMQRPPIDPVWLSWSSGTVPKVARTITDGKRWEIMPILADALEEAGCTDAEMLSHLRRGFEHGCAEERGWGCWVLNRLVTFEDAPASANISPAADVRTAQEAPSSERPAAARSWWQFWR
jgi:Clp amino terminal domain, pathogenicity island component